eukprot:m.313820 g.313820  ORF g.313820 m.313820 type:complete len:56 (+) comp55412_c0_seq1:353-520(+)
MTSQDKLRPTMTGDERRSWNKEGCYSRRLSGVSLTSAMIVLARFNASNISIAALR